MLTGGAKHGFEPRYDKTSKMSVRPAKTHISLGIRLVWSESSLSAWRNLGSLATHWAHSEDSDQIGRMPILIWVFAGRTLILLVLLCRGSFDDATRLPFNYKLYQGRQYTDSTFKTAITSKLLINWKVYDLTAFNVLWKCKSLHWKAL